MPPKYGAAPASSTSSGFSSSDEEDGHEVAPPPNPKPKPTAAAAAAAALSSSSDEDESSGSEEEEVAPPPNPKPKPTAAAPSSSDEDESSSGEEEVSPSPPNPKPTAAAKLASSSDEEESGSSDDDAPPASKPAPAVPAPSATPAKLIPAASATPSATKSKAFQRTWTDKDEIALLQGMLLYHASNGVVVSTNSDMKLFHQFIRGSLQIEVRPSQLFDRVRRFKAKYQKTRDNGESPSIAKPHDATIYQLSQKIWGTERVKPENGNAKESRAAKRHKGHEISNVAEEKNCDTAVAQIRYPYLADAVSRMGASILLNEVIGLVDDSEAMALDKRHKTLVMMQVDLTNDTAALIKKATENMC